MRANRMTTIIIPPPSGRETLFDLLNVGHEKKKPIDQINNNSVIFQRIPFVVPLLLPTCKSLDTEGGSVDGLSSCCYSVSSEELMPTTQTR